MKFIKDTQTTIIPDEFGELLRDYSFKEQTGCYNCFDLVYGFLPVEKRDSLYQWALDQILPDNQNINAFIHPDMDIFIAWDWSSGDGALLIKEGNRAAINTDCKKDYNWRWVKCPKQ